MQRLVATRSLLRLSHSHACGMELQVLRHYHAEFYELQHWLGVDLTSPSLAATLDERDPLSHFKNEFFIPTVVPEDHSSKTTKRLEDDDAETKAKTEVNSTKLEEENLAEKEKESFTPFHQCFDTVYLCGATLGLQPRRTGVQGYQVASVAQLDPSTPNDTHAASDMFRTLTSPPVNPAWCEAERDVVAYLSQLLGAQTAEVAVMHSATANMLLFLNSFYEPSEDRKWILIGPHLYPSTKNCLQSFLRCKGLNPADIILDPWSNDASTQLPPPPSTAWDPSESHEKFGSSDEKNATPGEERRVYSAKKWAELHSKVLQTWSHKICLMVGDAVLANTQEVMPVKAITTVAKAAGIPVGFDVSHAVGVVPLRLHDWGVDFATWCNYKHLSGGPGCVGGAFVHSKHGNDVSRKRIDGLWSHHKEVSLDIGVSSDTLPKRAIQVDMTETWDATCWRPGASGYRLSEPSITDIAALRAAVAVFEEAGWTQMLEKREKLALFSELMLREELSAAVCTIVTPNFPRQARGGALTIRIDADSHKIKAELLSQGILVDAMDPNLLRVALHPLYVGFGDVLRFVTALRKVWPYEQRC